ncbi:hypothetical protein SISNIDRAFT_461001 [Sistotremastrum niveocremeum HHB9708]|uniref:Uncharacterized protein n=1 Tax=Sistotremastrum niveocremeum HHB9708 TaxID=1314777 RepID=A0A164N5N9_9AGAM|nr:hypothetical protein SISNIDRAFT_461001 [Sistotremastrum niveocremeum HHB9708]
MGVYFWEILNTLSSDLEIFGRLRDAIFDKPSVQRRSDITSYGFYFLSRCVFLGALATGIASLQVPLQTTGVELPCRTVYATTQLLICLSHGSAFIIFLFRTAALLRYNRLICSILIFLALFHWAILVANVFAERWPAKCGNIGVSQLSRLTVRSCHMFTTMLGTSMVIIIFVAIGRRFLALSIRVALFQGGVIYIVITTFAAPIPAVFMLLNIRDDFSAIAVMASTCVVVVCCNRLIQQGRYRDIAPTFSTNGSDKSEDTDQFPISPDSNFESQRLESLKSWLKRAPPPIASSSYALRNLSTHSTSPMMQDTPGETSASRAEADPETGIIISDCMRSNDEVDSHSCAPKIASSDSSDSFFTDMEIAGDEFANVEDPKPTRIRVPKNTWLLSTPTSFSNDLHSTQNTTSRRQNDIRATPPIPGRSERSKGKGKEVIPSATYDRWR